MLSANYCIMVSEAVYCNGTVVYTKRTLHEHWTMCILLFWWSFHCDACSRRCAKMRLRRWRSLQRSPDSLAGFGEGNRKGRMKRDGRGTEGW